MNQQQPHVVFDAVGTIIAAIVDNLPRNQDMSEWTPLHTACLLGETDRARQILEENQQLLKLVNPNGCNALHLASSIGQLQTVELLLTFVADQPVNKKELCVKRDKDGRIPLHHAVINGSFEVVNKLLETCPESVLEVTDQRETVFHLAVKNKVSPSNELFTVLLGQPYSSYLLNLADRKGNTVLHLAIVRKQFQIVKLLIFGEHKQSLEVNVVNSHGLTPLDLLVIDPMNKIDREIETMIMFAGGIRLNESHERRDNLKGITSGLFVMASLVENHARQILEENPEFLKLVNPNGCNALHLASSIGQLQTVELLLTFADQNAINKREICMKGDKDGRIPLHHAVINGSVEVVKKLLEACPESMLEVTDQRETVFHLTVKYKLSPSNELFTVLIGQPYTDYLLNLADREGNTVLHLAVVRKQIQIVKLLMKGITYHGLEVNAVNSSGLTPLDLLVVDHMSKKDRHIENILISAGGLRLSEGHEQRENLKSITSGLFVMASLIAAACCQVAVYLQGSFWTQSSSANVTSSSSNETASIAKLLYIDKKYNKYTLFMLLDGVALMSSICLIVLLLLPTKAKYTLEKLAGLRLLAYLTTIFFIFLFLASVFSRMRLKAEDLAYLLLLPFLIFIVAMVLIPIRYYPISKKMKEIVNCLLNR
ncbi:hypothetical protein JCGZ_16565 [Jatropha curcas]|uniref:PGG domain-containing protein n=2 Tax=Jatropha curcas TaxID=180498 RepID=A0A067JYY1_JATCU|nr:hypothetical protein JCGZ_16565 [Jatropha curcas]